MFKINIIRYSNKIGKIQEEEEEDREQRQKEKERNDVINSVFLFVCVCFHQDLICPLGFDSVS